MASGKYSRMDGRRSSSCCSTVTVVVFVGVCLVGVWMLMSSSVVPIQNAELSSQDRKSELKEKVTETDSNQFEDTSGDLPEDAVKEQTSLTREPDGSTTSVKDSQNLPGKELANTYEENEEQKFVKEGSEGKTETEGKTKREAENDGKVKTEESGLTSNGESNSDSRDSNSQDGESNSEGTEARKEDGETNTNERSESEASPNEDTLKLDGGENKLETGENAQETKLEENVKGHIEEKTAENQDKDSEESSGRNQKEDEAKDHDINEIFPSGAQSEILNETTTQNGPWSTQMAESENEKESQKQGISKNKNDYEWKLCNVTAGTDYIPCLDNVQAIKKLHFTGHYEHRERHCPDEAPSCLVPLPEGYKRPIKWPKSREQIWFSNVPHTKLAQVKGHQNWVKVSGDFLTFPGGGTQFINGALHYIDSIQKSLPEIAWGQKSRVVLDVGCGVASFGGYLFERDVLAMSFAPKDEHEAQVQFALERGIPAMSAVMGTKRLPFPSKVFDVVHCARCRVPWHIEGGKLLLELNRLLRAGGYFVWSATPVYRKDTENVGIWKAMSELTKSMCWDLVVIEKDKLNQVGVAIYRKPTSNECYEKREKNEPPLCKKNDDPDAAWNVPLEACIHKVSEGKLERGSQWPEQWPLRLEKAPYWLKGSEIGVYGKPAPEDFTEDYKHWTNVVSKSYLNGVGINWSSVRNVMDMKAIYGGFAAALKDLKIWVMNVVPINSPDTLPIIYERGLFGVYHDWCESFSTYPRSYDLLHADHLFSDIKNRCKLHAVIAEVDRILRPEGYLIIRDKVETVNEIESLLRSLQWKIKLTYSQENEGLLCAQKTFWRPKESVAIMSAID
ncbi:Sarcosine/dimethylglycine N-methyltransferase [Bertholletia excelsa]